MAGDGEVVRVVDGGGHWGYGPGPGFFLFPLLGIGLVVLLVGRGRRGGYGPGGAAPAAATAPSRGWRTGTGGPTRSRRSAMRRRRRRRQAEMVRVTRTVLVVDDEPKILQVVRDYLADAGFTVTTASDGTTALAQARAVAPDLVVLDLGLPGIDGLDVARELQRRGPVPIIMLTARSDEVDRVLGLELGADDYLVKPFSPRELVARVRAVLRRTERAARPAATAPPGR